jgi:hypothetical protein
MTMQSNKEHAKNQHAAIKQSNNSKESNRERITDIENNELRYSLVEYSELWKNYSKNSDPRMPHNARLAFSKRSVGPSISFP